MPLAYRLGRDKLLGECWNPGLLLYRFMGEVREEGEKGEHWKKLVKAAEQAYAGQKGVIEAVAGRQADLTADYMRAGWHCWEKDLFVDGKLVVGMSYGRLFDVSLQLHPLYGMPYVPGSAVKGAVARYFADHPPEGLDPLATYHTYYQMFGFPDEEQNHKDWAEDKGERRGRVLFFDVMPVAPGKRWLRIDVINKHHKGYFEGGKGKPILPPTDYDRPEPIQFLTVADGVRFKFRLASKEKELLEQAGKYLMQCVKGAGIGAKTRRGLGRFRETPERVRVVR